MLGQMMQRPLLISGQVSYAAHYHGDTEIVSVETAGGEHRTNWREVEQRARLLGSALLGLGLKPGDRVATLAWNNFRHLEIYFGVAGAGLVVHTVNPRLGPDQMTYIFNHAGDRVLFIDRTFLPLLGAIRSRLDKLEHVYLMGGRDDQDASQHPGLGFYEDLVATGNDTWQWPRLDENTAAGLCYTSGTTGDPKGALYSHRSTVLHSLAVALPDSAALSALDSMMPVVPMFHVNAWGLPYAAAMVGAKLVLPGPRMDGASLKDLINREGVTFAAGVPTLWRGLLDALRKSGDKVPTLNRTIIGGSACPPSMIATFRDDYGVRTIHAWGMTETSPIGSACTLLRKHQELPVAEQQAIQTSQGRPPFGIDLMVGDADGNPLPADGKTRGQLYCKGPWVIESYFNVGTPPPHKQGWFPTGDIATIDGDGYIRIVDRTKDVIKSGGEWISSVELENVAAAIPELAIAAVVAARHEKWDERPLLIAVKAEGQNPSEADILKYFEGRVPKWQIPDAVVFVDALPLTGSGKVLKRKLRDQYGDYLLQKAGAQPARA